MPGGTLTGDGSKGNPYIVMDGYDLNALRTLIATSGVYPYVELGADINMAVYPVFAPLPASYCNIDGKGFRIYNLNVQNGNGETGLFSSLYAASAANINIEGTVTSTAGYHTGMLAGFLYLTSTDGKISNIHCSGSINAANMYSSYATGGICGAFRCNNAGNPNGIMESCSFYGSIMARSTASQTSNSGSMPFAGGIAGWLDSNQSSAPLSITKCIANFIITLDSSTANIGFGGIAGCVRGYGSSRFLSINRCVVQMEVKIVTAAASARTLCVGGMTAYSYAGAVGGAIGNIENCAAHIKLNYDPPSTLQAMYFAGILAYYEQNIMITNCYSVMSILNPNSKPLPASFYVDGIQGNGTRNISASFYDADVLAASFSGNVVNSATGVTTAQLKSQAFLESQGWVF